MASAVTISTGTTLNTSISNSSITSTTIPFSADKITIENNSIFIENLSYSNGEFTINSTSNINWSEVNTNIDSSRFPFISSSTQNKKIITSDLGQVLNGTITFNIDDAERLQRVVHTQGSFSETIEKSGITTTSSTASFTANNVGDNSEFELTYGCSIIERGVLRLIQVLAAIAILVFGATLFFMNGKLIQLTGKQMIMIYIALIIGLVMIQAVGDSIFTYCGSV